MADPSTPQVRDPGPPLGSTADPVGYVPVSWMAVAAFAVTAVFVLVLGASAFTAWRSKAPLIAPHLLFLPLVAVVLAFAARRLVRNSEGTRTAELFGFDLVNGAWWGAVVVGLVYLSYMAAVEFSIRREAEAEVARWVGQVTKDELTRAFHRTRDPAERASIAPDNAAALEARYRNDWVAFAQSDLVRIAVRNPGACEYTPGSLREWSIKPAGVECVATGTVRCPEGVFPVQFALRAVEATGPEGGGGRQWQVVAGPNGFFRDDQKYTPYGWLVLDLQQQAREEALRFLADAQNRAARPYATYHAAGMAGDPAVRLLSRDAGAARLAAVGVPAGLGWTVPDSVVAATGAKLFRLPGGKQPTPEQGRAFQTVWATAGLVPAGVRLRQSVDVYDITAITDAAVEVRVPVELPLVSVKGDVAARGRLVMVCTDAGMLEELKRLRAEAKPDAGSIAPPGAARARYPWRLDRVESDLKPVSARESEGPPAPGGLGGH